MKLTYQVNNPREIEMTMTVTMRLGEWELIACALAGGDRMPLAVGELRRKVQEAVRNASADFGAEHS